MLKLKKYGVAALNIVALVALFFPMANVSVGSYYETSLSGLTIAFQGYLAMLLFLGPIATLAADYVEKLKKLKYIIQAASPIICIIFTFVGLLQAKSIAAAGESAGGGYVDCTASFGFGGILCLIAHIGILVLTVLFYRNDVQANIEALKKQ